MALEDFQNNTPVIILNDHETIEELYEDVTLSDGDEATPNVFNKNIRDSVSRDISLEAAVTYLARSASLYTTNNTQFLSHCEGEGIDVIKYIGPYTGESGVDPKELFTTDDIFLGAAYPQGHVMNMILKDQVYNKFPKKNTNGWKMDLGGWVEGTNVIVAEDSELGALKVSTDGIRAALSQGVVTFTTNKLALSYSEGGVAKVPEKMSLGFTLKTGNLITSNCQVTLTINMYEGIGASAPIIVGGTFTKTLSGVSEYNNVLSIENITVPKKASQVGSPSFDISVKISFMGTAAPVTLFLSKFMAQSGESLYTWTETERASAYLQYGVDGTAERAHSGFVDIETNEAVTVMFWNKLSEYTATRAQKDIGPVFLSWKGLNGEMTVGFTHKVGEDYKLRLAVNKDGVTQYSTQEVNLPKSYFDRYFLSAIRMRKVVDSETLITSILIETAFAIDGKVYTISQTYPKSYFPHWTDGVNVYLRPANIVVGKDICVDSLMTSNTEIFTSRISEIRYDTEWVNDLELYLASLGRKPFSFKQSTDAQITTKQKSTTEVIDSAGINLIQNATGRFALIGWTQYNTGSNFSVSHTDPYMGNCFKYIGTPSANVLVYSDPIKISPSTLYSLRSFIRTRQGDTGKVVIGVRFSAVDTFDPAGDMSGDLQATCSHTGKAAYYAAQRVSPATAEYARVYMFVEAGSSVAAQWSKIKLEQGDPTFFTEDCGPNYAIYY